MENLGELAEQRRRREEQMRRRREEQQREMEGMGGAGEGNEEERGLLGGLF